MNVILLGDLCGFQYGDGLREDRREQGKVPVFGSNGIVGWHNQATTGGPTIIIGRKGSIGEINWSSTPCFPIDTTYYIDRTKKPCDLRWLFYMLLKLDLTHLNKSSAVPGLNREDAYERMIPFPDVPEQKRIAALLDQADHLRRMRRYAVEACDEVLPAVFLEMFGDPVMNPRGWPRATLEEVSRKVTDGEHLNPIFTNDGRPIVMAEQVEWDVVRIDKAKFVSINDYEKFARKCRPQQNDILMVSRGATIGRVCVVQTEQPFCLMGSVILIKPDFDKINSDFLCAQFRLPSFAKTLRTTSGASAQQAIYLTHLKERNVVVPPVPKQQEFGDYSRAVIRIRSTAEEALRQADHLFETLLHKAFGGEQ